MTIPYLMNCSHSAEGWCLACVKAMGEKNELLLAACKDAIPFVHSALKAAVRVPGFRPEKHAVLANLLEAVAEAEGGKSPPKR